MFVKLRWPLGGAAQKGFLEEVTLQRGLEGQVRVSRGEDGKWARVWGESPAKWLSGSYPAFLTLYMRDWSLEELTIAWGLAAGTGPGICQGTSGQRFQNPVPRQASCPSKVPGSGPADNSGDFSLLLKGQLLQGPETSGA